MRIEVLQTNITALAIDAIVNAANPALAGGGGVDGAIHRAAGPELHAACKAIPMVAPFVRCPVGEARITPGFALPARYVIHTVGPVWEGGHSGEAGLLGQCYAASLRLATEHGIASIAFPAISCGVYGYPPDQAVAVAVEIVRAYALTMTAAPTLVSAPAHVIFCAFDTTMAERYRRALERSA